MTDFSNMSHSSSSSMDPRAAAIRMVAAAEYFKSAGELPSWARTELESWSRSDARDVGRRSPDMPAT